MDRHLHDLLSINASDPEYMNSFNPLTSFYHAVPLEVEHTLIWTRLPILPPPTLVPSHIRETLPPSLLPRLTARLNQDGIWGFTGSLSPPPSPSLLPTSLGALSEWGITMEKVIRSERGTAEEEEAVRRAGEEVNTFVKRKWNESEWETAWFVNPPVSSCTCRLRLPV